MAEETFQTEYRVVGVRCFPEFPTMPISWQGTAGTDREQVEALATAARERGNQQVRVQRLSSLRDPWEDFAEETS